MQPICAPPGHYGCRSAAYCERRNEQPLLIKQNPQTPCMHFFHAMRCTLCIFAATRLSQQNCLTHRQNLEPLLKNRPNPLSPARLHGRGPPRRRPCPARTRLRATTPCALSQTMSRRAAPRARTGPASCEVVCMYICATNVCMFKPSTQGATELGLFGHMRSHPNLMHGSKA